MGLNNSNNRSILVLSDEFDLVTRRYGQKHGFNIHSFADPSLALKHFRYLYPTAKHYTIFYPILTTWCIQIQ